MTVRHPNHRLVTIHEAKTHLSRLIAQVEAGDEVILARGRMPVAKLVPLGRPRQKRELGWLKGDSRGRDPLAYGFWDPIPDAELALWNGEEDYPGDAPVA